MLRYGAQGSLITQVAHTTGILTAAAPHSSLAPTPRNKRAVACAVVSAPVKNSSDWGGTGELRAEHWGDGK